MVCLFIAGIFPPGALNPPDNEKRENITFETRRHKLLALLAKQALQIARIRIVRPVE